MRFYESEEYIFRSPAFKYGDEYLIYEIEGDDEEIDCVYSGVKSLVQKKLKELKQANPDTKYHVVAVKTDNGHMVDSEVVWSDAESI